MVQTCEQYKQLGEELFMLQVHRRIKMNMAVSSSLMVDEMKRYLTQVEKKIFSLIEIISRLTLPLVQA